MLATAGTVKVLDFGLAKAYETSQPNAGLSNSPTMASMGATNAGVILGTAAYMSPEQARGKPVDKRTDIWAFGCVLYALAGSRRVHLLVRRAGRAGSRIRPTSRAKRDLPAVVLRRIEKRGLYRRRISTQMVV